MRANWEERIRNVKLALYCRVHPKQDFRQIVVSEDIRREIKESTGTDISHGSLDAVFESLPIVVDSRLEDGCIIFIPKDPICVDHKEK